MLRHSDHVILAWLLRDKRAVMAAELAVAGDQQPDIFYSS